MQRTEFEPGPSRSQNTRLSMLGHQGLINREDKVRRVNILQFCQGRGIDDELAIMTPF